VIIVILTPLDKNMASGDYIVCIDKKHQLNADLKSCACDIHWDEPFLGPVAWKLCKNLIIKIRAYAHIYPCSTGECPYFAYCFGQYGICNLILSHTNSIKTCYSLLRLFAENFTDGAMRKQMEDQVYKRVIYLHEHPRPFKYLDWSRFGMTFKCRLQLMLTEEETLRQTMSSKEWTVKEGIRSAAVKKVGNELSIQHPKLMKRIRLKLLSLMY
jgi:hypothetical protein